MNLTIHSIKFQPLKLSFRSNPETENVSAAPKQDVLPVYGDTPIRTNPAQLSLFSMHDFHGQNVRMEKAYTASKQFDNGTLFNKEEIFSKDMPVDNLKVASGDMFLGENEKDLRVVNDFLNISGVVANAIGNHECDSTAEVFSDIVKDRHYKLLGANMHPNDDSIMKTLISESFVIERNGNKYGLIGLVPPDMAKHLKRPEDIEEFNISDFEHTIEDMQGEVNKLKEKGVNKIILLSHTGLDNEKYIAQNVSDIDIILGGHTHNFLKEAEPGKNLFLSPKGEPVVIMQVGRDGEHIGIPNVQFNEYGQIKKLQYNVLDTDDFERSLIAKKSFEDILGKSEVLGKAIYVENPPKDIYATENPHCDFITDCIRKETGADIALMNSANIRGRFDKGDLKTRELSLISPFGNKMSVIQITEEELVNSMNTMVEKSMKSEFHRPGIIQVSGLRYEYSKSKGKMTKLEFLEDNGNKTTIDLDNPRKDKFYTIAVDDYCATSPDAGLNLKQRFEESKIHFTCDKDKFVGSYLIHHKEPVSIKSDGRIKIVD